MWTKQYLRNFEDTMNRLVNKNKLKPKHRDIIIELARKNSDIGYEKYKWCFECGKRQKKNCVGSKVCYKGVMIGYKPLFFMSWKME